MSEQSKQDQLYSYEVTILDKYTCLSMGATTINDLKNTGRVSIPVVPKDYVGKKPDVLIIDKDKRPIVFIEFKLPSEFNSDKKVDIAINQELNVAREIGAKIYVVTDGNKFIWINPSTGNKILDDKNNELNYTIKPKSNAKELADMIDNVVQSINSKNDKLLTIEEVDPTSLATSIASVLKKLTFASTKEALYTFVEVFLFKYLSDIGILLNSDSFDELYAEYEAKDTRGVLKNTKADVLYKYFDGPRKTIKNLFPEGEDGTSIINGKLFHVSDNKTDGHYTSEDGSDEVFYEVLKKFKDYGVPLINISKEFKSKLFEMFINNSGNKDKSSLGKYFTPLKVVQEMVRMVNIEKNMKICDPACGVGKFILEAVVSKPDIYNEYKLTKDNQNQIKVNKPVAIYGFEKDMNENGRVDITIILAKANALLYFSKLFKQYNDLESIRVLSQSLLNDTFLKTNHILGTLRDIKENEYDLILANPPYYQSAIIAEKAKATGIYENTGHGIESLFTEWIIKSLKAGGIANIVLPDGLLSNIDNERLKKYILETCEINAIIALPKKTFYNTPKKTYIMNLRKKISREIKQKSKIFSYICTSIGETLDTNRFKIDENDLHEAVNKFNRFKTLKDEDLSTEPFLTYFKQDIKLKLIDAEEFKPNNSWIIENWWSDEEQQKIGIKEKDLIMNLDEFKSLVIDIQDTINEYEEAIEWLKEIS